jgi:hypothetical protein
VAFSITAFAGKLFLIFGRRVAMIPIVMEIGAAPDGLFGV